ncbi:hypothetical protein T4C_10267 [Trichinella pseudospiralis]|uniref:Uncharacterized protein n=1 Tax=Trichinella pseudospiralis TaxID=6337 RepID=A0A0V1K323_TRIPS|nr:hypothetical protein T4C_10267 [Trichinella pseudospiralis]
MNCIFFGRLVLSNSKFFMLKVHCLIVCFDINLTKIEEFLIIITTACIFVLFGENNFQVFEIRKFISVVM